MSHDLFTNDALIFKGLNTLEYYYDERSVKVKFDGFTWLGVWSMSDAPFVCIEPWYGLNDFEDHNMNIFEKEGIEILEGYETFKTEYSIEIE